MRRLIEWFTHDWVDKVLALGFAIIIFYVVDDKITKTLTETFRVEFGPSDRQAPPGTSTIFLTLQPGYTASLESPAGGDAPIRVQFSGPRQVIQDIRRPLVGSLSIRKSIGDPHLDEEVWDIDESEIRFQGVDPGQVSIQVPALRIRVLRVVTRLVDVVADHSRFRAEPGFQKGDAQPERPAVRVTCPKKYFTFTSATLVPDEAAYGAFADPWLLERGDNRRRFKVKRPADVPPGVDVTAEPTGMNVVIPLLPEKHRREIEVAVHFIVPTDGRLGSVLPRPSKTTETFTFIGPAPLLEELQKLEGTDRGIEAVIDLAHLNAEDVKKLREEGLSMTPDFRYPSEEAKRQIRCEQPKSIWVAVPKE